MTTTPTTAQYAQSYCNQFGLHLVPLPPRSKRPLTDNWGNLLLADGALARDYYTTHPDANMGVALGPSRLCSFDVDDEEATRIIFAEFGWDLDALRDNNPTIQGQAPGFRVMFRVPDGMTLKYHALTWPKRDEPGKRFTVWEIRAADTQQRQDVLPPSIHPDTGLPYIWLTRPVPATGFPPPPDFLLRMWEHWDALKPQFQGVCPWVEKPRPTAARAPQQQSGPSVIGAYDERHSITEHLSRYGYKQQGKRWLSPHSTTGLPGVMVFEADNKAFIHHASDPLCSMDGGQPRGPFDLFMHYEHQGDMRKAVRAAGDAMGMAMPERTRPTPQRERIDPDTGEITAANDNAPQHGLGTYDASCVDWFSPFPDANGKGKPLSTIENVREACRRLGVTVRYNVINKEIELLIPGEGFTIDNQANASLAWLTSACSRFGVPTGQLGDFLCYLADRNQYNPVAQWITSKPWDGTHRLQSLYNTIKADGEDDDLRIGDLKEAMLKRWLISAVAGAFRPTGVSAHGVLVIQGEQYLGKTAWFKSLVPADLGVIQDGMMLKPDDRDSIKQAVSFWLVELGELDATFRKSDIAQLKAFITRDRDTLRRAYAKLESHYARRTVFFASVNPRQFLHDPTGNRRYWTISATDINHKHDLDMQQVWAEVYENHYLKDDGWYLTADEMSALNSHNKDHEVLDPIRECIQTRLDWEAPSLQWRWMTATDIMQECGFDRPTRADVTQCGQIVLELNGKKRKVLRGRSLSLVPPRIIG